MGLTACGINPALDISPQQRELKPQGTLDFPCAGYAEHYAPDPGHSLPWHWHDEFEVIYILSGELTAETPGARYPLTAGDCIAFNAGVLHSANTATAKVSKSGSKCTITFGNTKLVFEDTDDRFTPGEQKIAIDFDAFTADKAVMVKYAFRRPP